MWRRGAAFGLWAVVALAVVPRGAAAQNLAPGRLNEATVWIVCEPVYSQDDLKLALSVQPDVILRAWFKWGWTPALEGYAQRAREAARAHERGVIFGGGVTCAAVERGEMGLSEEKFLRIVARTPANKPAAYHGQGTRRIYHGAIESPEYLDYVLSWAYRQIDAGATALLLDEVDGGAQSFTGYTDKGLRDFREYLIEKYLRRAGWKPDDPRWTQRFKIALDDKRECADGTIRTFDYRAYLRRMKALEHPTVAKINPLAPEWGPPNDTSDTTYCGRRNRWAWDYLLEHIRAYAAGKKRRVYIACNGLNRGVDFQVIGVGANWPVTRGRLTTKPSYLTRWRSAIDWSRNTLGRDVPVVVYHDWGFEIPWEKVPKEDRLLWLRVYAPEIFAAGAFFAWPVSGCGGRSRADKNGTLEEIWYLARWYKRHAEFYHNHAWIGANLVRTAPDVVTTLFDQTAGGARRLVHVINHKTADHRLVARRQLRLDIPSGIAPKRAYAVSPDDDRRIALKVTHRGQTATVVLDRLVAYTVVVLEYDRPPNDEDAMVGRLVLEPAKAWGEKGGTEFHIGRKGVVKSNGKLNGFLHGLYRAERRVVPVFHGNFAEGASISLTINSVARLGSKLLIKVDGKTVAEETLPDLDGADRSGAREYNRVVTARIPPGRHAVTLENGGGDWLTLDRIVFEGVRGVPTSKRAGR